MPLTPTVIVTGNLVTITGAVDAAKAQFDLVGFGATVPRVQGTAVIVQTSTTATADGSGNISVTIWGLDVITPRGCYYTVTFFNDAGGVVASLPYDAFTGSGSFDLSQVVPMGQQVVAPQQPNAAIPQIFSPIAHNFLTGMNSLGVLSSAQPSFSDLTGTLTAAQLPLPTASTLGGVKSLAAVSHKFITSIGTDGIPVAAQPTLSDIGAGALSSTTGTFTDILTVTGNASLPAATGSQVYWAGGFTSPASGRLFIGDGTGWQLLMSKRTASVTTDLFTFQDNGNLTATGTINSTSAGGFAIGAVSSTPRIVYNSGNGLFEYEYLTGANAIAGIQIGGIDAFETAGLAGLASHGRLWADSTSHFWKASNNNGTAYNLVGDTTTQTLSNKTLTAPNIGAATGTSLTVSGQLIANSSNGGSSAAHQSVAAIPAFAWDATGQAADQKWWDAAVSGTSLLFRTVNDANSTATNWLTVARGSGIAVSSVTVGQAAWAGTLNVAAQDGVNEGGEIHLLGAAANTTAIIDTQGGNIRLFGGAASPTTFNLATGAMSLAGLITSYNGITTSGNGTAIIIGTSIDLVASTSTSSGNLVASAPVSGMYQFTVTLTGIGVNGGASGGTATWTVAGIAIKSVTAGSGGSSTDILNTPFNSLTFSEFFSAGAAITYSVALSGTGSFSTPSSFPYTLHIRTELIG